MLEMYILILSVNSIRSLELICYLCRGVIGLLGNWMKQSDIVFVVSGVMAFCCLPSEVIGQLGYRSEVLVSSRG